jgi:hypothetical protein
MQTNEEVVPETVAYVRLTWETPSFRIVRASNAELTTGVGPDVESVS